MNIRRILAIVALTGALVLPSTMASAAEPLPTGTYVIAVNDDVSVVLVVDETGDVDVDAPRGVRVEMEYDKDGWPLDEFDVLVKGEVIEIDVDVTETGAYTYIKSSDADFDVADDEDSVEEASADDEASADGNGLEVDPDAAPGQHGRDNAREHGGNANGHGAEDTGPAAEHRKAGADEESEASAAEEADEESEESEESADEGTGGAPESVQDAAQKGKDKAGGRDKN